MSGSPALAPLDAVAKPEYKRYIFEGNFPYRKWLNLFAALSVLLGALLFIVAIFLPVAINQLAFEPVFLKSASEGVGEFAASLLALGLVAFALLVAGYIFPPASWFLFRSGASKDVKKLGKRLARSWETEAPKYFKGFEDPIRKHIYYPGLNSVSHKGNQLILLVILPNGVVSGGVSEYCKAASLEMQSRLGIPARSVAFGHHEYVDELDRKTKPDLNTATFVLTPKDYSLLSRKVKLG